MIPLNSGAPRHAYHRLEITIPAAVHNQCLVTTAEQVPEKFVPPIEARRISAQQPFHPRHQIGLRRLHHQMKMIGHEAEVPAIHHLINRTFI
jgi:hypothetical protein